MSEEPLKFPWDRLVLMMVAAGLCSFKVNAAEFGFAAWWFMFFIYAHASYQREYLHQCERRREIESKVTSEAK